MRKIFTLFIFSASCLFVKGQVLVSTDPQPRNSVLEVFTGINCPNCPDGDVRAEALHAAHPGRVVILDIHAGSFAVPSGAQPDFRTPYGEAIDSFAGVAAYPSGDMNRLVWPGAYNIPPYYPQNPPNNMAIRRPGWWDANYPGQGCGEYIILNGGLSPVNIGSWSEWNDATRELTIHVELYYTQSDTDVSNKLNVALTENNVVAYQSNGGNNYNHMHTFRDFITGQWGEAVSPVTAGTLITKTYVYTVSPDFNIDNCDISIFVTRSSNAHTHSGVAYSAKNGNSVAVNNNIASAGNLVVYPNPASSHSVISFDAMKPLNGKFILCDARGAMVGEQKVDFTQSGIHEMELQRTFGMEIPKGVYVLFLKSESESKVCRFVVTE